MKRFLFAIAFGLGLVSGFARANDVPTVKMEFIQQVVQNQGESKSQFIDRVAVVLDKWIHDSKFEACGQLAANEAGNMSVVIVTVHAHGFCATPEGAVVEGYKWVGESIHVHPNYRWYTATDIDQAVVGAVPGSRVVVDPRTFSDGDYKDGAGYLVTGGRVLYQNGRGTAKVFLENF